MSLHRQTQGEDPQRAAEYERAQGSGGLAAVAARTLGGVFVATLLVVGSGCSERQPFMVNTPGNTGVTTSTTPPGVAGIGGAPQFPAGGVMGGGGMPLPGQAGSMAVPPPAAHLDVDRDGIPNTLDNCIAVPNPGQEDLDQDTRGDACDNCVAHPNLDQNDWDKDGLGDVCDPDPPPQTCGNNRIQFQRLNPNILAVLDRSGSMALSPNGPPEELTHLNTCPYFRPAAPVSNWREAAAALNMVVQLLAHEVRFGLAVFPGNTPPVPRTPPTPGAVITPQDCNAMFTQAGGDPNRVGTWRGENCNNPELRLPVGDHTAQALLQSYSSEEFPYGATPMSAAVREARTKNWLVDPTDPHNALRDKAVLLITDGTPTDTCDGDNPDMVVGEITQLSALGIRTYVVGFGSGFSIDPVALDRFAAAGGTNNPSNPQHGYYQATNAPQLANTLKQISRQLVNCTQILGNVPAAPDRIYTVLNGVPLVRDDPNGFHYDPMSNTVTLVGQSCAMLKTIDMTNLQIVFGCPPGGGPPILR